MKILKKVLLLALLMPCVSFAIVASSLIVPLTELGVYPPSQGGGGSTTVTGTSPIVVTPILGGYNVGCPGCSSVDLTAYEQAFSVPPIDTIAGGPFAGILSDGSMLLSAGNSLHFQDETNTFEYTKSLDDSGSLNNTGSFNQETWDVPLYTPAVYVTQGVDFTSGAVSFYQDETNTYNASIGLDTNGIVQFSGANAYNFDEQTSAPVINVSDSLNLNNGSQAVFYDSSSVYNTSIVQNAFGLTIQPNNANGIQIVDPTNSFGTNLYQTSQYFTIYSKNMSGINLATNGSPLAVDGFALGNGQYITANSMNGPTVGNFIQQGPIVITTDTAGNTYFGCPTCESGGTLTPNSVLYTDGSGAIQSAAVGPNQTIVGNDSGIPVVTTIPTLTTLNFNCEFNAGYSSGTTAVIMPVTLKVIGDLVTLSIQARPVMMGTNSQILIRSDISANPGCIPLAYRPNQYFLSGAITHSQSSAQTGTIQVSPSGDIQISYSVVSLYFPPAVSGGLGTDNSDVRPQTMQYTLSLPQAWTVTTNAGSNGSISPTLAEWIVGTTPSLTFYLEPDSGYVVDTATDTCLGGSSGGTLVGDTYVLNNVNQNCNVNVTFTPEPASTFTITSSGTNSSVLPTSDNWFSGSTTELDFSVIRSPGNRLSSITDNCNAGLPGGTLIGSTYKITTVTGDCQITTMGRPYVNAAYFDFTATGSILSTPNSAYSIPNFLLFGFPDITATALSGTQLGYITNAIANETPGSANCFSIGGATTPWSLFNSTGFSTVISNINAQITQINGVSAYPITCVDLDLEGSGWNPTDIGTLISGFSGLGYDISIAPQLYTLGGDVNSGNPTNLILTAGGGTGNTYGPAVSAGGISYIFVQTYNTPNFTIDSNNEASVNFTGSAMKALSNTIQSGCSGSSPLCIASGPLISLLQVANAGAGGFTIFNPTNAPTDCPSYPSCPTIPSYNQSSILNNYSGILSSSLSNYPLISGLGMWAINNDWAPTLYNNTDSASQGGFSKQILQTQL